MDFALFEAVKNFNYLTGDSKLDDDFVDRINRYWTALLLVLFAVVLSARQIVGEPLRCWTPQEFSGSWIEFTQDYCWVKNTYFVPKNETIPDEKGRREQQEIGYYQWIPYVLVLQAFMYYLPAMIWRVLNWKSGLDLTSIVSRAADEGKWGGIAFQLATNMRLRAKAEKQDYFVQRSFLTFLYLLVKILYAVNSVGQFLLLSSFFGRSYDAVFSVIHDLAAQNEWHTTGHFPRITFCDFAVRRLGQMRSYTVQCVLIINIFTEKIFVIAGVWMLLVAAITVVNLFNWFIALALPWRRDGFIRDLLPDLSRREREQVLDRVLGNDGLMVFHLITTNNDEVVASRLLRMVMEEQRQQQEDPAEVAVNPSSESPSETPPGGSDIEKRLPDDLELRQRSPDLGDATLQLASRAPTV